jgi:hypothetical protein
MADPVLAREAQVRLVDEGRGAERVVRALPAQTASSEDAQLVVEQVDDALESVRFPVCQAAQSRSDVLAHQGIVAKSPLRVYATPEPDPQGKSRDLPSQSDIAGT